MIFWAAASNTSCRAVGPWCIKHIHLILICVQYKTKANNTNIIIISNLIVSFENRITNCVAMFINNYNNRNMNAMYGRCGIDTPTLHYCNHVNKINDSTFFFICFVFVFSYFTFFFDYYFYFLVFFVFIVCFYFDAW